MVREARQPAGIVLVAMLVWTGLAGTLPPPATAAEAWTVTSGEVRVRCRLTVGGSFEAVTAALSGHLRDSAGAADPHPDALRVDLATLDTGIGLRDTHLRERYLEVARGPEFRHAVLTDIALAEPLPAAGGRHETSFAGSLALHGVERPIRGEAELQREDGRIRVEAEFSLRLDAFDIPPPRYLGVGVRDEITIAVRFVATRSAEAPRNGTP